jgi:hypothetical protein
MRTHRTRISIVILLLVAAVTASAQTTRILFRNQTGATIYFLYASPVSSDSWGDDLLGMSVLGAGEEFSVLLRGSGCFDVRAIDSNENEYIIWNRDVSANPEIRISRSDYVGLQSRGGDAAFGWVNIVNYTNYSIQELYIVPAGTREWRDYPQLLRPNEMIHDGEDYRAEVDVEAYGTFLYDIILVDEDRDRYIKREVNLELVSEVIYTLDDFDWH